MVQEPSFMYDGDGSFLCLDTARIITGKNINFLLSILNSSLFFFAIKLFYGGGGLGSSGVRMKHAFFEAFSCPLLTEEEMRPFSELANKIISKKQNKTSKTFELENKIDELVYDLYKLTTEEKAFIENNK